MASIDPTGIGPDEGGEETEEESTPDHIEFINDWLDEMTEYGTLVAIIRDRLFTAAELGAFWGISTSQASGMLQRYRESNYFMDERCMYVIAHEGPYGPGAPWRLQSTAWAVPETTRRVYRFNQIRHITWDVYDHTKKQVKSFGAESRQALVMLDEATSTAASSRQRQMMRDFARDILFQAKNDAKARIEMILATMGLSRAAQDEFFQYILSRWWDYVEAMVDEEIDILNSLLTPPGTP